jgi:membrane protease YdiL (CAAX protease family)
MPLPEQSENSTNKPVRWLGILVGMSLPSLITWGYFVAAADYPQGWQQSIYLIVKVFQFTFPLGWVFLVLKERPRLRLPTTSGVAMGLAFGLVVVAGGWAVYATALRELPMFHAAAAKVADKVHTFGITSVWKYAFLATFYSLVHSLLEEYYWRWFVYGRLRQVVPPTSAMALSALGFAGHHVIVLAIYFGAWSAATWLLSAAIVVGGLFWAWLYERTQSLLGPWLSHLVVDAGIFWIGFELLRDGLAASPG